MRWVLFCAAAQKRTHRTKTDERYTIYLHRSSDVYKRQQEAYVHLRTKIDGKLIQKRRYLIPAGQGLTVELDVFEGELAPLCLAEVEFPDEDSARSYIPPEWFQNEVTYDPSYHNSSLSK